MQYPVGEKMGPKRRKVHVKHTKFYIISNYVCVVTLALLEDMAFTNLEIRKRSTCQTVLLNKTTVFEKSLLLTPTG